MPPEASRLLNELDPTIPGVPTGALLKPGGADGRLSRQVLMIGGIVIMVVLWIAVIVAWYFRR